MNTPFKNAKVVGENIKPEDYMRQPEKHIRPGDPGFVMSRGALMDFLECPHKWLKGVSKSSDAMDWGTLIDTVALTPQLFDEKYVITPEKYQADDGTMKDWNWNAKVCKGFREDARKLGREPIKKTEYDEVKLALAEIKANQFASELLEKSRKQVMVVAEYHDPATGLVIPLKCLLDFVPPAESLGDFKSTANAQPDAFEWSIFDYNYDAQAYLSTTLFNLATGEKRKEWQFLVQENTAPYEFPSDQPMFYDTTLEGEQPTGTEFFDMGKAKVMRALRLYCQCLKTGRWPSYNLGGRHTPAPGKYLVSPNARMSARMVAGMETFEMPATPEPAKSDNPNPDVPP